MPSRYHIVTTSYFDRDVRCLFKKNPRIRTLVERAISTLQSDPYNLTGEHHIRKLQGLKKGEGVYRLRIGDFRIRYDSCGSDIILYSFRNRKDAYR